MFTTRTQTAIFTNIRTIFPTIILDKIFSGELGPIKCFPFFHTLKIILNKKLKLKK